MDDPARAAGGTLGEYAFQSGRERPMAEVIRDIFGNVQEMVRSEVRLARAEMRDELGKTARAGAMVGIGGVLGLIAAVFLLVCLTQLLALFMPNWLATLVMTLAIAIPAAVLIARGRQRLHVPKPDKTIENVKENVEWMKNQTRS